MFRRQPVPDRDHHAADTRRGFSTCGVAVIEVAQPPAAPMDIDVAGQPTGTIRAVASDSDDPAVNMHLMVGAGGFRRGTYHRRDPLVHATVDDRPAFGHRHRCIRQMCARLADAGQHRDEFGKYRHGAPFTLRYSGCKLGFSHCNRETWAMAEPGTVRARRKEQTRQRIAETALLLFARNGFDNVTVAQVAQAASVTEKTVFNHFKTKEDLVYSQDETFKSALLDSIRTRSSRESVLHAVERFLLDRYRRLEFDPASRQRSRMFASLVAGNPTLQARERAIHARYADALSDVIAQEQHAAPDDIRPRITAEAVLAVHRGAIAAIRNAVLADVSDTELAARATVAARRGFRLLARGLAGYAARR